MTLPDTQLNSTELLSSMTPEQKLGQLFLINLNGIEADQDFIKLEETYHFGNVYLSGQNLRSPEQVQQLNRQLLHLITDASGGIPHFCHRRRRRQCIAVSFLHYANPRKFHAGRGA